QGDGKWKLIAFLGSVLAGIEILVGMQLAPRNRAHHRLTLGEAVAEELAAAIGHVLGLIVHVLAAAGREQHASRQRQTQSSSRLIAPIEPMAQFGTSVIMRGLVSSRNWRVRARSNCGSAA